MEGQGGRRHGGELAHRRRRQGNEGVAAFVGRLPNSIGYVEYAYVKQNKMNYVQLQNADGAFA